MPELRFFIGSYDRAGGGGVYPLVRRADGQWRIETPWPGVRNASFGVYSPRFDRHYLVDEMAGTIATCRYANGEWARIGTTDSAGEQPCHLALDAIGTRLACANYGNGIVSFFRLDPDSGMPVLEVTYPNHGSGPDRERQEGPHAHWVGHAPHGERFYQIDLGTDEIRSFETQRPPQTAYRAPPGSGPRHLAFTTDGGTAYLVSELASTVTELAVGEDALRPIETQSTLPPDFNGDSLGGHIGLNAAEDRLYVTNRGHDSVAVFARAPGGGLRLLDHVSSGGASPRFFLLLEDEGEMLVANEEGNSVSVLAISQDGGLSDTGTRVSVPGPVFIGRPAAEHVW